MCCIPAHQNKANTCCWYLFAHFSVFLLWCMFDCCLCFQFLSFCPRYITRALLFFSICILFSSDHAHCLNAQIIILFVLLYLPLLTLLLKNPLKYFKFTRNTLYGCTCDLINFFLSHSLSPTLISKSRTHSECSLFYLVDFTVFSIWYPLTLTFCLINESPGKEARDAWNTTYSRNTSMYWIHSTQSTIFQNTSNLVV